MDYGSHRSKYSIYMHTISSIFVEALVTHSFPSLLSTLRNMVLIICELYVNCMTLHCVLIFVYTLVYNSATCVQHNM